MRALGGRKLGDVQPDREAAAVPRERPIPSPRGARRRDRRSGRRSAARAPGSRAAGACSCGPSGTEPLVRVMVEAPDESECKAVLGRLVEAAEQALG